MVASLSRALACVVALTMATCSSAAHDPLFARPRYQVPDGGQDRGQDRLMSGLAFAKLFLVPLLLAYYFRTRRLAASAQKKAAAHSRSRPASAQKKAAAHLLVPGKAEEGAAAGAARGEAQGRLEVAAAPAREGREREGPSTPSASRLELECSEIQADVEDAAALRSPEKECESSPSTASGGEPEADSSDAQIAGDAAAGGEALPFTMEDSDESLAEVLAFVPSVAWVEGDSTSRSFEAKSEGPSMISGVGEPEADSLEVHADGGDEAEASRSFEEKFESPSAIFAGEPEADSLEVQADAEDAVGSEAALALLEPTEEEEEEDEEEEAAEKPVVAMTLDFLRQREEEEVEGKQERLLRVLPPTSAASEDAATVSRASTMTQLPRASEAAAFERHAKASSVRATPRTAESTPRTAGVVVAKKKPAPPSLAYTRRVTSPNLGDIPALAEMPKAGSARVPLTVRGNSFTAPMASAPGTAAMAAPLRGVRTSLSRPSSQAPAAVGAPVLRSHNSWRNVNPGRVLSPTSAPSTGVAYSRRPSTGTRSVPMPAVLPRAR